MNDEQSLDERTVDRWLNRLADNELDEPSRRLLMEWLDEDPFRWRRCALVMLESKEFERSIGDWATASTGPAIGHPLQVTNPAPSQKTKCVTDARRSTGQRRWRTFSTVSVVAIATFVSGIIVDRCWTDTSHLANTNSPHHPQSPDASSRTANDDRMPTDRPQVASETASEAENKNSQPNAATRTVMLPDYVRGQLERQGYRVNSQQKLVSVVLPGGEQMTIPVEEWKFQFTGHQIY